MEILWLPQILRLELILSISRIMLAPEVPILIKALDRPLCRHSQRRKRDTSSLEILQPRLRPRIALVDAEHADTVRGARDVETPVPGGADVEWLRVEAVVPLLFISQNPPIKQMKVLTQRHTISIQPSTSHGKSISQVRHANLRFGERLSTSTAYQLKPPSALNSTRSGQRPPPL
jgi:hypothetical protein